jgi:hypothetical protein
VLKVYHVFCVEFAMKRTGLEHIFLEFKYFPYIFQQIPSSHIITDDK